MGLQVIGAGLGRTGTASLKVALEQLGFGQCYHYGDILINPDHHELWVQTAQGKYDWDRLFSGYEAAVDNPTCVFWKELAEYYPEAKIILTTRDANQWFDSVHSTILSPEVINWALTNPVSRDTYKIVLRDFGDHVHDRTFMVDHFIKRNTQIIESIPSERLLVYEVNQGWEPLCNFLEVPVPNEPYPRVNRRNDTQEILQGYLKKDPTEIPDEEFRRGQAAKLYDKKPTT